MELALLSILAAFGVAFGILYMALTLTTGKRKRRNTDLGVWFTFADFLWIGKKQFVKINLDTPYHLHTFSSMYIL